MHRYLWWPRPVLSICSFFPVRLMEFFFNVCFPVFELPVFANTLWLIKIGMLHTHPTTAMMFDNAFSMQKKQCKVSSDGLSLFLSLLLYCFLFLLIFLEDKVGRTVFLSICNYDFVLSGGSHYGDIAFRSTTQWTKNSFAYPTPKKIDLHKDTPATILGIQTHHTFSNCPHNSVTETSTQVDNLELLWSEI